MKKIISLIITFALTISIISIMKTELEKVNATSVSAIAEVEYNGNIYKLYELPYTWEEARIFCEMNDNHLVTITSSGEQAVVEKLIAKGKKLNYWLGASRNSKGEFIWITGEPFSYTNWSQGQPDNSYENSLMMYGEYDNPNTPTTEKIGLWNDIASDGKYGSEDWFGVENFGFISEQELENEDLAAIGDDADDEDDFVPGQVKNVKLTNKKVKRIYISYSTVLGADGYQIQCSSRESFSGAKSIITSVTKGYFKNSNEKKVTFKKGKSYYVRVRAYTKNYEGDKVYGMWSSLEKVTILK